MLNFLLYLYYVQYWLTYWAVYGCLFVIMDLSEKVLGRIPGFYTLIIFSTIYLMLPMFRGADKVFRKILVPLAGLQEVSEIVCDN
jgi:hypothetical protein